MTNIKPLQANETRTAALPSGDTVTLKWVAGGMFAAVQVRDSENHLKFSRNYQFSSIAEVKYAQIVEQG